MIDFRVKTRVSQSNRWLHVNKERKWISLIRFDIFLICCWTTVADYRSYFAPKSSQKFQLFLDIFNSQVVTEPSIIFLVVSKRHHYCFGHEFFFKYCKRDNFNIFWILSVHLKLFRWGFLMTNCMQLLAFLE